MLPDFQDEGLPFKQPHPFQKHTQQPHPFRKDAQQLHPSRKDAQRNCASSIQF